MMRRALYILINIICNLKVNLKMILRSNASYVTPTNRFCGIASVNTTFRTKISNNKKKGK